MSNNISLTIACAEYDRTRPLKDGAVKVEGCDVTYLALEPEELFFRAFRSPEFDVAELSFNSFLMQTTRGDCPYVAIPAFVSRRFRHSAIFIRTDRGIKRPEDLRGKLVGLPEYQQTANVWMRGIFEEQYGIKPSEIRWRTGGQEEPGRDERTPLKLPDNIDIAPIPADKTLSQMLIEGELDAVFSAREISAYTRGAPNIDLLFPNYREVESEFFDKTGHFPIMHLVGVRKTLVEKYPWLPANVFSAFCRAKDIAVSNMRQMAAAKVTLPWPELNVTEAERKLGADYWRYGVKECYSEIETLARYSYEQGLAKRLMTPEEIFHPTVHSVSRT